jgi:hypothetical protein
VSVTACAFESGRRIRRHCFERHHVHYQSRRQPSSVTVQGARPPPLLGALQKLLQQLRRGMPQPPFPSTIPDVNCGHRKPHRENACSSASDRQGTLRRAARLRLDRRHNEFARTPRPRRIGMREQHAFDGTDRLIHCEISNLKKVRNQVGGPSFERHGQGGDISRRCRGVPVAGYGGHVGQFQGAMAGDGVAVACAGLGG